jgi:asparagine synthase (glutamine-hydrolysing)
MPDTNVVEAFWELLNSAVDLHLRSDVPVGTCLSGGVDSSTLVCLASRRLSAPIHTFSGLYPDADCDEKIYVDAVNAHAHTRPVPIWPEPRGSLIADLTHITWHQDEPSAGPGLYTQFHVMQRARHDVKVLLDGQGGDELYAGYLPYFLPHLDDMLASGGLDQYGRASWLVAQIYWHWGTVWGHQAARRLLNETSWRIGPGLWQKLSRSAPVEPEPAFFHPALVAQVHGQEITRRRPATLPTRLGDMLYWHLRQQSIPALLHYEDRNSMAFSIEARVPYLDYRLVEFAMALEPQYKIHGSWTKWILRQAAARVMPSQVAWRRSKLGYPTPFARWLREGTNRDDIQSILFSRTFFQRELVSEETVRFYWDQHQAGRQDRSWLLYRYVMLELWFRHFIDRWQPAPATTVQALPAPVGFG